MRYPFLNLKTVNEPYADELREAACRVLSSGQYIGGCETEDFEHMLAEQTGTQYAVGVSNGLDALRLIFRALILLGRLHEGDGVAVPANTYIASVLAISDSGLTPVFVDADERSMNMDTSRLKTLPAGSIKAVLTVHLYGRPCWDKELADFCHTNGLQVVEDNAQAIGAVAGTDGLNGTRVTGSLGHAAAFSFYPTKNIGALGDAGAVTTSDREIAVTVRALANYGSDTRYHNLYRGFNCRMDPLQAAMLKVKLPHTGEVNGRRRRLAATYNGAITNPLVTGPLTETPDNCVWHQYVILCPERDRLRDYLTDNGVGTDINYPVPVHLQPCYSSYASLDFPVAERLSRNLLCLPISSCTSENDAREISAIINNYGK